MRAAKRRRLLRIGAGSTVTAGACGVTTTARASACERRGDSADWTANLFANDVATVSTIRSNPAGHGPAESERDRWFG
jgi:hypothetical protein